MPLCNWLNNQGLAIETFVAAISDHPVNPRGRHGAGLLPGRLEPIPSHAAGMAVALLLTVDHKSEEKKLISSLFESTIDYFEYFRFAVVAEQ